MSFLKTIWEIIKKTFSKSVVYFFKNQLSFVRDKENLVTLATVIVNNLATVFLSDTYKGSFLELLIPDNVDDVIKDTIEKYLIPAAAAFTDIDIRLAGIPALPEDATDEQKIENFNAKIKVISYALKELKNSDNELYTQISHTLASVLSLRIIHISDTSVTLGNIFAIIESVWQGFTKKKILPDVNTKPEIKEQEQQEE